MCSRKPAITASDRGLSTADTSSKDCAASGDKPSGGGSREMCVEAKSAPDHNRAKAASQSAKSVCLTTAAKSVHRTSMVTRHSTLCRDAHETFVCVQARQLRMVVDDESLRLGRHTWYVRARIVVPRRHHCNRGRSCHGGGCACGCNWMSNLVKRNIRIWRRPRG
jgi:hypothetical protein